MARWISTASAPSLLQPPFEEALLLLHGPDSDCLSFVAFQTFSRSSEVRVSLLEPLSPLSPAEPPDPPGATYLLVHVRILKISTKTSPQNFTQTLVLIIACSTMVTKFSGGGAPLVSFDLIVEAWAGLLSDPIYLDLSVSSPPRMARQILFPIVSPVWNELAQALLVLQGSSSQRIPLYAFGVVILIL
ncbi:unnamed protein product [Eruca vesicaria subsp. sativa]|uniref:Uncharacterized protein n=1 Tax=Eruca vesicaria subsp. sativa TaxID=29727 RepID=A0ABC8K7I5_ERUVS|nr:unnamed protein product [Eruca vesicaria subsp. sativa]